MELIAVVVIVVLAMVVGLVVGANNKRRVDEARKNAVAKAKDAKKRFG